MRSARWSLLLAALLALFAAGELSAQARPGRMQRVRAAYEAESADEHIQSVQTVRIPLEGDGGWPLTVAGHHGELHAASLTSDDPALAISADLLFDGVERTLGLARVGAGPFTPDGCHVRSGTTLERVCTHRGAVELSSREDTPSAVERRQGMMTARVVERLVLVSFEREAGASTLRAIELAIVRTRTLIRGL